MTDVAQEPSGFRWNWFSQFLRYSFRHSHFFSLHQSSRSGFSVPERSPTILVKQQEFTASVGCLSLGTFSVPAHSTSELLRTLSMVAASKPTSWLLLRADSLSH